MYLLAYDEEARGPYDRSRTGLLVRTAVLVELALRGRLVEAGGGSVAVAGTGSTGIPFWTRCCGRLLDTAGSSWSGGTADAL